MSNVVNLFKETDSELALKNAERDLLNFESLNHDNFDSGEDHLRGVFAKLCDFVALPVRTTVAPLVNGRGVVTGYEVVKRMENSPVELVVSVNAYPLAYEAEGEEC